MHREKKKSTSNCKSDDYCLVAVLIRGTMTPDTYKPMLSVRIKPLKAEDKFTPGEYFSPRIKNSGAYKSTTNIALVLFVVSKALQMR